MTYEYEKGTAFSIETAVSGYEVTDLPTLGDNIVLPRPSKPVSDRGVWGSGIYSWGMPFQTSRSEAPSTYVPNDHIPFMPAFGLDIEPNPIVSVDAISPMVPAGTGPIAEATAGAAAAGAALAAALAINFAEGALAGAIFAPAHARKEAALYGGIGAAVSAPAAYLLQPLGIFGTVLNAIRPFAAGLLAAKYKATR